MTEAIPLDEGHHVFNLIMQETGIDPYDRTEEVKANDAWAIAKSNLQKSVTGES
jgi:hypothetical protein